MHKWLRMLTVLLFLASEHSDIPRVGTKPFCSSRVDYCDCNKHMETLHFPAEAKENARFSICCISYFQMLTEVTELIPGGECVMP